MKNKFISLEEGTLPLERLLEEEELLIQGGSGSMSNNGCNCKCGHCSDDNDGCNCECD